MLLILSSALIFLLSRNNGGMLLGSFTASGVASTRRAIAILGAAIILGVVLEGWKVHPSNMTVGGYLPALLTSLTIFLISNVFEIPISLTSVVVLSLIGSSLAWGLSIDWGYFASVITAWMIAPIITLLLAWLIHRISSIIFSKTSLLTISLSNRLATYLISVYAAYSLGTNTVGFIFNMAGGAGVINVIFALTAILLGVFFSGRTIYKMGERFLILSPQRFFSALTSASIVLWILTQFGIPGILTYNLISAFIAMAWFSPLMLINVRQIRWYFLAWIGTSLASIPVGYVIGMVVHPRLLSG